MGGSAGPMGREGKTQCLISLSYYKPLEKVAFFFPPSEVSQWCLVQLQGRQVRSQIKADASQW